MLSAVAICTLPLFFSFIMSAFAAPSHPSRTKAMLEVLVAGPFRFSRTRKPSVPGRVQSSR
ncbi:hypothetical protein Gbem_4121 [Citrifermentans bemidjiense Bem]|uniref:Secreted protein n=1 Tax=Citrifermentans bemidjiense (strain ATCC BAA-1014 / DSM 16622 / JCM 12645 / Bem) TaxID=404380 RepID=E1P6C3_CITBB|nr:hypothetical protein Gbem_4121 [Citrifermentans bemidjiense Bem]